MGKIVLYGAGKRGYRMYQFLCEKGYNELIYGFCDKKAKEIGEIKGKKVWLPQELKGQGFLFCITVLDEKIRDEIKRELCDESCIDFSDLPALFHVDRVKFNRDFCAFYHIEGMDSYFWEAEDDLDIFWRKDSTFYQLFQKLDLTNVIELACGRGRHVPNYLEKAERITLVDILQNNIDFCKERFKGQAKIHYYKNNGHDLRDLPDDGYSALYSYDAMVHFELLDIFSYLKEVHRILKRGGYSLIHHSNYSLNYKADFSNAPESRSFMSKECFAYLAYRAGFQIIEQKVIDWNGIKELDCITLLQK